MAGTLLSFGHGYSAQALADLLRPEGWRILGTTRSREKSKILQSSGIEPVIWPNGDITAAIQQATHILISIGPNGSGDPVLNTLKSEIGAAAPHIKWVGYLSTTGVYGDHRGNWVNEDTPLTPSTERGKLRVSAEREWQKLSKQTGLPLHIFRLAGIYGPGRGPFAKVRAETARRVIKKDQVFSRIHVHDIAQILYASISRPNAGAIYNVCDDAPAPPQDVIAYAAKLLGMALPPEVDFETADLSPMARSFYAESKKVANDRVKQELGVTLKYPSYIDGLNALLAAE